MLIYTMCLSSQPEERRGLLRRLRFRKLEDLDLLSIARAAAHPSVEKFIALYERSRRDRKGERS